MKNGTETRENGADPIERKPFRAHARDLFFDLRCTCAHPRLEGCTYTILLTGYADANFFDNVNAKPRLGRCKCGREYLQQWFRDGVEATFKPTELNP